MTKPAITPDGERQTFGAWLHAELAARGYNMAPRGGGQSRFAEDTGIHRTTIRRILADEGEPDPRTISTIAQELGVPVLPLLILAGIIPDTGEAPPPAPRTTLVDALAAAGVRDPAHVDAILTMVRALHEQEAGPQ